MQIQNALKCDMFLPYAGTGTRGVVIKAGKLSHQLPPTRFNDPLLQRDWKRRKINIVLSDSDRVYLGAIVDGLQTIALEQPVAVTPPVPVVPVPEPAPVQPTPIVDPVVPEPVKPPTEEEKVPTVSGRLVCALCGKDKRISIDDTLHIYTCSWCKRARNKQLKEGKMPEDPTPQHLEDTRPEPPTPAEIEAMTGQVKSELSSGVPGTAQTLRQPPTLAELMAKNATIQKRTPKSGAAAAVAAMAGPMAYMEQDNLARQAAKVL